MFLDEGTSLHWVWPSSVMINLHIKDTMFNRWMCFKSACKYYKKNVEFQDTGFFEDMTLYRIEWFAKGACPTIAGCFYSNQTRRSIAVSSVPIQIQRMWLIYGTVNMIIFVAGEKKGSRILLDPIELHVSSHYICSDTPIKAISPNIIKDICLTCTSKSIIMIIH